jgi:hypothetical protein
MSAAFFCRVSHASEKRAIGPTAGGFPSSAAHSFQAVLHSINVLARRFRTDFELQVTGRSKITSRNALSWKILQPTPLF